MDVDYLLKKIFCLDGPKTVVEWCRTHVTEIPYSPVAFDLDKSPILRALLEELEKPRNRYVMILACVQSGKTLAPELFLSYLIENRPGPTLWLNTTDAEAKDQAENRIGLLFDALEPVKLLANTDKNKMRIATKTFSNGMTVWFLGQNNLRNLQRRSVKYVFGDETWQWSESRMAEAEGRITAFADGKCIFMSQAGTSGDQTDLAFESSTKNEWTWICPHCKNEWIPALENFDENNATMTCPICKTIYSEKDRTMLAGTGMFIPRGRERAKYAGFRWNCFSTMDWREIATLYKDALASSARANDNPMRIFFQKRLAEPWGHNDCDVGLLSARERKTVGYLLGDDWQDEGAIDVETFEIYAAGTVPAGAQTKPLRFMTVDVQKDRFYWVVRAWSKNGCSRLIDCGVARRFENLREIAEKYSLLESFVGIDCGYTTDEVFTFCAQNGYTALRGDRKNDWLFRDGETKNLRPYSPKEIIKVGNAFCGRHYFSTMRCKDVLEALRHGNTALTWTYPDDAPASYERMLYSEVKNDVSGIWEQIGSRPNHFFDCEAMNIAMAIMTDIVG